MRPSRANGTAPPSNANWELPLDQQDQTYSSSEEEDERSRLQKPGGGKSHHFGRRSSEVNSPNGSDNTYAEANLLQGDKGGGDLSDSDVYGGSNGSSSHRYQVPHNNILRSPHREPHRFLGGRSNSTQDAKNPFYGTASRGIAPSRTSTNLPIRRAANGPLPDPPLNSSRRGQLVMTPDRTWGTTSETLAETRLGNREGDFGLKYGTSLHLAHQTQPKGRSAGQQQQQQSLVSSSGGSNSSTTKASSLHRRSLSDDSLSIDKQLNQNSSGGSTSTALITSACVPPGEENLIPHHTHPTMDPIVMPGFPVRTLQGHPPPPYSPSREKFRIGKRCQFHCSWKLVAFALTLLTLVLSSVIAYFGAVKFPSRAPLHDVIISEDCITSDPPLSVLSLDKQQQMQQADSNMLNSASRSRPVTITLSPGHLYEASIDPMTYWRSRLPVHRPGSFRLNLTFSSDSSSRDLAIYGKARFPPSVTNYDWIHITNNGVLRDLELGSSSSSLFRGRRSSPDSISLSESFPLGDMFIAILNDGLSPSGFQISLLPEAHSSISSSSSSTSVRSESSFLSQQSGSQLHAGGKCLHDCSGQGACLNGKCVCNPRFSGPSCSLSVCPLVCSGNGVYRGGSCVCSEGWKGDECDVLQRECLDPDCNGNGACSEEGLCVCEPGWTGDSCQTRDCMIPDCYGHGVCRNAVCHCHPGWMGENCQLKNEALLQCLPNCSGHGIYDYASGACDCQDSWTGPNCNITLCSLDCGTFGSCRGGACVCEEGWSGSRCAYRDCDPRCKSHGQCKDGKCLCMRGWNGKHCGLNGCGAHGKCNGRGECEAKAGNNEYGCKCNPGWTGRYCEYHEETDCEDGIDNDENGLTDCADSRCCSHPSCRKNIMCVYSADPVEVLSLRERLHQEDIIPESGASFFQRSMFLFFTGGAKTVQSYAKSESFDPERASIIRGRVITSQGQGIIGVRVSVDRVKDASNYGFTLTRPEGWFDMVVNGGGAVTLQFQRSPLKAMTRTTYIPWNRIVVINPVVMTSYGGLGISRDEEDTSLQVSYFEPCYAHDYEKMKPRVSSSHFPLYTAPETGHLSPERLSFRESLPIPSSGLSLSYLSSLSPGYKSIIEVRLTPREIHESLDNITLKITLAGSVFRKSFEADPGLTYEFHWDKKNAYRQVVYGVTEAEVSMGYHYRNCMHTIWVTRIVKVRGQETWITDVGGWNLNVHHHFNRHQGILEKGDGSFHEFNHKRIESVIGGSGTEKRAFLCAPKPLCEHSLANQSNIYEVISMTTGPDGSLYIGDYNVIRRVKPDGSVISLLFLGDKDRKYIYDLKISPADNKLYMTNAESYQVFIIEDLSSSANPANNSIVIAGTGKRCLPGDRDHCGDGGKALHARLSYPKSLAVSVDRTLYLSDGQNIRRISSDGLISTLIGHHRRRKGPPKPLNCQNTYIASKIQLQWPTKLELNPLDSSLHIVDDTMILRLTSDRRVVVLAGSSSLCHTKKTLGPISDIAFSSEDGQLYISSEGILHLVDPDGHTKHFHPSTKRNCICPHKTPDCSDNCIRAITSMASDGPTLYISDSMKVLRIRKDVFSMGEDIIRVRDPLAGEVYSFNAMGTHLFTHHSETDSLKYSFKYTPIHNGRRLLHEIRDADDRVQLSLDRVSSGSEVSSLTNAFGRKFTLKMSSGGSKRLLGFGENTMNAAALFEYEEDSGLLKSSRRNDGRFLYVSNDKESGRVSSIVSSSGENVRIEECQNKENEDYGSCITLKTNGAHSKSILFRQNECKILRREYSDIEFRLEEEGSTFNVKTHDNIFSIKSFQPENQDGGIPSSLSPVVMTQRKGKSLLRSLEWDLAKGSHGRSKKLKMNGRTLLDVRLLEASGGLEETFSKSNGLVVTKILYNENTKPAAWQSTTWKNCSRTYDTLNRLIEDRCGRRRECFVYDSGTEIVKEKTHCGNGLGIKYFYSKPPGLPTSIEMPLGSVYAYDYDEFGALSGIRLPKSDFSFAFKSQIHFGGKIKTSYAIPGLTEPFVTYSSPAGALLEVRPPNGNGVSLFKYIPEDHGTPRESISADVQIYYRRQAEGKLHRIEIHYTDEFIIKDINPLAGTEEDEGTRRISFSPSAGFASASFKYSASSLSGHIGGSPITKTPKNGLRLLWDDFPKDKRAPREQGDFLATHLNLNETLLTDGVAYYSKGRGYLVLEIHGREVFRSSYEFEDRVGQLRSETYSSINRRSRELTYHYDAEGRLLRNNEMEWQFDGDLGNLIKTSSRSKWKKKKVRHLRYKPGTYMRSDVEYDESGRVSFNGGKFTYMVLSGEDRLRRVELDNGDVIEYTYDQMGRLIGRSVNKEKHISFFYAYPILVDRVSHIYEPESGSLTQLRYDEEGQLIYVDVNGEGFYVVNDFSGSPILFFAHNGGRSARVAREVHRSPYGVVLSDTNPEFPLPIDFKGGIKDPLTGFIHLQDLSNDDLRIYDPKTSSYLTPCWKRVPKFPYEPLSLNLYSYSLYNPLKKESKWSKENIISNLQQSLVASNNFFSMATFESLGLLLPSNGPLLSPTSFETEFRRRMKWLISLSHFSPPTQTSRPCTEISRADSPLGRFVTFDPSSSTVFSVGDGTPSQVVTRSVFEQVLKGSQLVEFRTVPREEDMLFFTKSAVRPGDVSALRRLGPSVNLTIHESQTSEKEIKFLDVKVHLMNTILNIRYGTSPTTEKARLLRHAYKTVSRKTWVKERTSGSWSPRQLQSLLSQGFVPGYTTRYRLQDVQKYPELSTDLNNVAIVPDRLPK